MELGWKQAVDSVTQQAYSDNWIRTFRQSEISTLDKTEQNMLQEWLKEYKLEEIMIYLTGEDYRALEGDMAEFMLREMLRGNL